MKNDDNLLVKTCIWLIKNIHQKRISPQLNKKGTSCRFYPSCSDYGIKALKKYGFLNGWHKTIKRISKCRIDNYRSCIDFP
ncbi:membrane protein insertion efficiency factor YidD [Candidatus Woesearchaeota archaeon]|nr:membrane protein insertion efficiency factor YidD [Candidatus Woesearchaeota archaeon]